MRICAHWFMKGKLFVSLICVVLMLAACSKTEVPQAFDYEKEIVSKSAAPEWPGAAEDLSIREEDPVNLPEQDIGMKQQVYANAYIYTGSGKAGIQVETNPSTGYTWQQESSDELVLCMTGEDYLPYEYSDGKTGVGGLRSFDFTAGRPGEAEITLRYSRTFEEGRDVSVKTFVFQVDENLDVILISAADPDLTEECYCSDNTVETVKNSDPEDLMPDADEILAEKQRNKERLSIQ